MVCNGKIKRALGVERMPVGARDGLLETLRGGGGRGRGEEVKLFSLMVDKKYVDVDGMTI